MSARILRLSLLSLAASLSLSSLSAAPKLMQGPMLGHVDEDSAQIWARVAGEAELRIEYAANSSFTESKLSDPVKATAENDYCVTASIEGLEASSYYYYRVVVDGETVALPREQSQYPLLTAPSDEMAARFTIAFGAGAKTEIDGLQAIWLQVQNARPHAFFWLGDNESSAGLPASFQAEQYRKQRGVPFLQPLLRSIPQMATWDGPSSGERKDFDVFRRYWANPSFGTEEAPGSYFKYHYANVDFFFLDTYSYRKEGDSLLGEDQLTWLRQELSQSDAVFKVLLSSCSWTDVKSSNVPTWMAYPQERDTLLSHINSEKIPGVFLISGDNDQAEIKAIPMSQDGGYDLYELVSSPLALEPVQSFDEQDPKSITLHEPYAASMNFGLLSFDLTQDDPVVAYEVINVFGESVFPALEVKASELTPGTASWQSKVDNPEAYATVSSELNEGEAIQ